MDGDVKDENQELFDHCLSSLKRIALGQIQCLFFGLVGCAASCRFPGQEAGPGSDLGTAGTQNCAIPLEA